MTPTPIAGRAAALAFVVAVAFAGCRSEPATDPAAAPPSAPPSAEEAEAHPSALYGRVTTYDGTTYEGRLRWGGGEEAFWDHYFNGFKDENPWATHVPVERLTEERPALDILGVELGRQAHPVDLGRPFMVRFGDIARIEARGDGVRGVLADGLAFDPDVRVTLKSGTAFDLDRLSAGDFDDGVRVWDRARGAVDLGPRQIHTIVFLPAPPSSDPESPPSRGRSGAGADRLHGTVRTRHGDFTGFLQWNREEALGRDHLVGYTDEGELALRFDALRAIARHAPGGALVTLRDGREVVLSGTPDVGDGHRGVYVDDARYGRVLVSWDAFERVDFSPGGPGPAYGDFPPGRPLTGSVTTRDGRHLAGRLVYDLDESETTETLDAPSQGVDYTLPFGLVASIALPGAEGPGGPARVTLHSGEALGLERAGDLDARNAGMLVFTDGSERPTYVPWADVQRVEFDRPPETYPPVSGR